MRLLVLVATLGLACGDNRSVDPSTLPDADPLACKQVFGTNIVMRQVATVHGNLLLVTGPPRDPRQFVVEQAGRIWIIENDKVKVEPFLDISPDTGGPVLCCAERGLLGLAFHPDYANNGIFFVYYTTASENIVARYQRRADNPSKADPASGVIVLSIADFAANHNGGMIDFGADGMLYIGTGDGGGGGDPMVVGQDPFALLGKILRIDIDNKLPGKEYGIPPGNPFFDSVAGAPEVYVMGLRNPWRWSFDTGTGDLWIGDVGQDTYEEVDYVPASMIPGANFGWSTFEGQACFRPPCAIATRSPFDVRTHAGDGWCSSIGGQVYRGACYPDLVGRYFYTDYCHHTLEVAKLQGGVPRVLTPPKVSFVDIAAPPHIGFPVTPASIHADGRGELYLTTTTCCGSSFIGGVYHLEATR